MDGHQSSKIKDSDAVSSTGRAIDEDHKCGEEKSDSRPIDEVEMRRVFERFDEDGNGLISANELQSYMKRLGHNHTDSEVISMIQSVDRNNDGCVDFDEFLSLYKTYSCPGTSEVILDGEVDDLLEAFRIFDKDKDGYISAQELQAVLLDLGLPEGKSLQKCKMMIQKVDEDGNGQCDIEEFKK